MGRGKILMGPRTIGPFATNDLLRYDVLSTLE
jgi:hypothetical protein